MKIYTKTGDDGTTALFGGKRLGKDNPIVEAYGTLDELTSHLGMVIACSDEYKDELTQIQKNIYHIMAATSGSKLSMTFLIAETRQLEQSIDKQTQKLPALHKFILPQGSEASAYTHIARTVCRRAERRMVGIQADKNMLIYINRLSDYLFTLARTLAKGNEVFA